MKRQWKLLICLLAALLALTACSGTPSVEDLPDITQNIGPTATPTAEPVVEATQEPAVSGTDAGGSIFLENPYLSDYSEMDPLAEEDYVDPEFGVLEGETASVETTVAGTEYPYAGSTPIPLDPVDMPTPTPRPDLTFTYAQYIATNAGVTFEGPQNWQVNESQAYLFILSEPTTQIKDGQQCIITISAEPIGANYDQGDLETHVEQRLDTLGGTQFSEFKPSYTATRYMMGTMGVYANYTGTLTDGTEVGGRIHYVSIDNVLYGLEIVFPEGFREDYIDLFGDIRSSMERI